jgi:hypothetical protein
VDGADRAVDVDDEDANPVKAASTTTIVNATSPRFIENTLTVPGDDPTARRGN